jgi:hypothetical protein
VTTPEAWWGSARRDRAERVANVRRTGRTPRVGTIEPLNIHAFDASAMLSEDQAQLRY